MLIGNMFMFAMVFLCWIWVRFFGLWWSVLSDILSVMQVIWMWFVLIEQVLLVFCLWYRLLILGSCCARVFFFLDRLWCRCKVYYLHTGLYRCIALFFLFEITCFNNHRYAIDFSIDCFWISFYADIFEYRSSFDGFHPFDRKVLRDKCCVAVF